MDKLTSVRNLIKNYGIKETWLAKTLEIKESTLHYLLFECDKIDDDLYERIHEIVNSYQFELTFPEDNEELNLFNENEIYKSIGERIRIFAKRKFGTLKNLSVAMEISPQQLQQYISGTREPGAKILHKLLKLGCDLNWLLGGIDSFESFKVYRLENEIKNLHKNIAQISSIIKKINIGE